MKSVNQKARAVLHQLAEMAEANGGHIKIDNGPGFMPVHVEHIGNNCMSVAHYGEQNGDAMRDPEIVFWEGADLGWYPVSYRNDYLGINREAVTEWDGARPKSYLPREQADEAVFSGTWMDNISQQQGLSLTGKPVPA